MNNTLKMYMDESCHTKNSNIDAMSLVTIYTINDNSLAMQQRINFILEKYKMNGELKWNKVSNSNLSMYKEVISILAKNVKKKKYRVRALLINIDKSKIRSNYEDWYYKMAYYLFVHPIENIDFTSSKNITKIELIIDEKDNKSKKQAKKLSEFLTNKIYGQKLITSNVVDSKDEILIQLSDIIAGAITYKSRSLKTSNAKLALIAHIEKAFSKNLSTSSPLKDTEFNLLVWRPKQWRN